MNVDIKTADGADIELGATYYTEDGEPFTVNRINLMCVEHRGVYIRCWSDDYNCMQPDDLYAKTLEPDSWEKLEEDIDRASCIDGGVNVCEYYGHHIGCGCDECPAGDNSKSRYAAAMSHDFLARAKKLAGVE